MRLELSSEGRYALRALVYLACLGERASADRISAEANVPRRLLARILASLSRAGLVESEQHDEWQVAKRYFSAGSLAKLERKEVLAEQTQLVAG